MSSNQHPDNDHSGPSGTVRIGPATEGPAGTARIDAPAPGPEGTARIDAAPAGPAGTARMAPLEAGPEGTARVYSAAGPGGTARVGADAGAAPASLPSPAHGDPAQHLMVGQTLVLRGTSYQVESALSTTTSEARTYVVTDGTQRWVLKYYRPGLQAPLAALAPLQASPHPNVVAIHDFGSEGGQDFELLEYFPAGTLDQLLRRDGPLRDLDRLRRLVRHLADGLEHLHDRVGLIYQDLKPENVLVSGPDLARVVVADFGISSLRAPGTPEVQVTANGTREYAAPELARFANETQTFVTEKVDYFALGITLLECWQGERPFQGLPDGRRVAQVQDREVPFPAGMDPSLETLIKGLLNPSARQRFGLEQVRRWLANEALEVDYTRAQRVYERLPFRGDEHYETPSQLAALLEQYPALGLDYLYLGTIGKWLEAARDMELATQIAKIVRQFDQDDAQREAGLRRAIYTLDASRPFVTAGGRHCVTADDLGDALLAERDHYIDALVQPSDPFYLYLHARGEADFATETRTRFLATPGTRLAFNQLIYALQSGGRNRVQIAGRFYFLPEDLANEPVEVQQALRDGLMQRDSRVLLWLQRLGIVEQLAAMPDATPVDLFSVARALPWLRLADFVPDVAQRQGAMAHALVQANRQDLLEEFVAQGLDFNAPNEPWKPLVTAAADNDLQAVVYMLAHGASMEVADAHGNTPLAAAIRFRRTEVFELLLSRGANVRHVRPDGQTLLGLALLTAHSQVSPTPVNIDHVRQLLAAGADANQPGADGSLPLHLALVSESSALPLVDLLLAHRADIHRAGPNLAIAKQGPCDALFTALYAFHFEHRHADVYLSVIERLLKAGARVDGMDQGKAPLHWAAVWGHEGLTRLLLAHGARRDQVGDGGMLPGTYARLQKAARLEPLLAPGVAMFARGVGRHLLSTVLKLLVLVLMLAPLLSIGHWLMQSGALIQAAGGATFWRVYGQLLLMGLTLALTFTGSWRLMGARLKASAGSMAGWVHWLVWRPVLLGGAAWLAALWVSKLSQPPAWLWTLHAGSLAFLAAALVMTVASVAYSGRARAFSRAYDNYVAAGGPAGKAVRLRSWATTLVVLAVLLVPAYAMLRQWGGVLPENEAAASVGHGVVVGSAVVRDSRGTSCTLPSGTALSGLRPAPDEGGVSRWWARAAKVPARCARLANTDVAIARSKVRWLAEPPAAAARIAPVAPGVSAAPVAAAPPAAREPAVTRPAAVSGLVRGLSPEGWPQIDGRTLPLQGLDVIPGAWRGRFESWLATHDHQLNCEPASTRDYRCFTRGGIDAAEALLLNGVASASADASAIYKERMAAAVAAKRGQWK